MLLIDLFGLFIMVILARNFGYSLENVLGLYTLSLVFLSPIVGTRYDLFPSILVFFAFYALWRGWNKIAWTALALATLAKIYPIFLAPLFALFQWKKKDYQGLLAGGLIFISLLLFLTLPWLVLGKANFFAFLNYHKERGLQIESFFSPFLLLGNIAGLNFLEKVHPPGTWNIHSWSADFIAKLSPIFILIIISFVYWFYFQALGKKKISLSSPPFLNYCLAIIIAIFLTSKVLSPQYFLWLCPFIPFIQGKWRPLLIGIFLIICGLTTYIWPFHYLGLLQSQILPVFILFIRNFLLVIMIYFLLKEFQEVEKSAEDEIHF
jgi:hypothetical protein